MTNVQIALSDPRYAKALGNLLRSDGAHRVFVVDQPLRSIDGVVVLDEERIDKIPSESAERERYVVLMHEQVPSQLNGLWKAGVRHVIFAGDAPSVAQLAVIAAEMRTRHCN